MNDASPKKTALALVFDGIEEVEALAPVDLLRRAGVEVAMASVTGNLLIEGRNGIRFQADCLLETIDPASFDLLILPGGPGVIPLAEAPAIIELIQRRDRQQGLLAAICAAPKVLAAAGVLQSRQATSHASVRAELPNPCHDAVVRDAHIITSQGAGTAVAFGLALVEVLLGSEQAQAIAASIHA